MKRIEKNNQTGFSSIYAASYISESELRMMEKFTSNLEYSDPHAFNSMLWDLGMNVYSDYTKHDLITHRNKLGKSVCCARWVGTERHDDEWINSGYASSAAIDRSKNSPLLDSIYKQRAETTEIQNYLSDKDRDCKIED